MTHRVPWNKDVFLADVETYYKRGIRHITTFAVWIDADDERRFGNLDFMSEHGEGLSGRWARCGVRFVPTRVWQITLARWLRKL
ncbi:MAG TPA: hypothetical protein VG826_07465 [Pirellulales bacterium]|nr:hypothetical protein [Pirellulales bacterium]